MPSTYTTNNGIELIGTGEQSGTWGDTTNTNLTLVDASLDGHTTITLVSAGTSGSPNSLPIADGSASNGRNRALVFTDGGDLGATVYVQLTPNDAQKIIFVRNSLSGSRNLILFQGTYSASNDFVLAAGKDAIVKFDGGGSGAIASAVLADLALDAATITTISNTTLNTATVNATTVDTTSVEVTNLKAKDGTASATIANSTGVMTIASSVLTTTDINGGTIDGTTIGGTSAAAVTTTSLVATTADINGGTIDGTTIGGASAGAGTFTTATATTGNITTVNATTVDTTNIEVTTLKAKDGTSAGSIADSTGVVTLASSVLTTTDINGGTIDGTVIGGTTPAAVTGTTITGTSFVTTGDMTFGDNDKAIFGAGSDLQIYHDGSHSYITDEGTGSLYIRGSAFVSIQAADGTNSIVADTDNEVTLYHNGSAKLATTSTGVAVTGTITSDGLTVDTSTLYVDATNNRVGIGTVSPVERLDVAQGLARFANNITPTTESDGAAYFGKIGDQAFVSNTGGFAVRDSGTNRLVVDTSGNVGIGVSSPSSQLHIYGSGVNTRLRVENTTGSNVLDVYAEDGGNSTLNYSSVFTLSESGTERMRIDSSGNVLVGKTSSSSLLEGAQNNANGSIFSTVDGTTALVINRLTSDGTLVSFRQDGTQEGTIAVSGTTVSYNGGHLSRWSQMADGSRPDLLKGTVMSNLDQMANWDGEANEQLNCTEVSTVEGDANVAGVFVAWDSEDDGYNDILLAMTGDMVIRIAGGTTVQRGDLLMSAGDGTAKPQGDDIVRSKTIAKVTSTNVSHTYEDGSYAVPCVLMAC